MSVGVGRRPRAIESRIRKTISETQSLIERSLSIIRWRRRCLRGVMASAARGARSGGGALVLTSGGLPKLDTFSNFDEAGHAKDIVLADAGRAASAVKASKGGGWFAFVRGPPLTSGVHTVYFTVTSGCNVGVGVGMRPLPPGAYTDAAGTWIDWLNGGGIFADGVCVRACMRACVHACVRACVCACG